MSSAELVQRVVKDKAEELILPWEPGGGGLTIKKGRDVLPEAHDPYPFQTRLRAFPDKSKTNTYPIVDKQYNIMLICSVSIFAYYQY